MMKMNLMNISFLVAFLLFSGAAVSAQTAACASQQVPELRGFRLGMNLLEVRKTLAETTLFDTKVSQTNSVGSRAVRISGAELKEENGEGVDDVDLTFIDERLSMIRITYNSAMRFEGAQDFLKRVTESMGLSGISATEVTQVGNRGNEKYKLECKTFSVSLVYSFGVTPNVTLADSEAQRAVKERREQQGEGEIKTIRISPGGRPRQP
jgi:hypothetical protein